MEVHGLPADTTAAVHKGIAVLLSGDRGPQATKDADVNVHNVQNWVSAVTQDRASPTGQDHSDLWHMVRH